MPSFYIRILLLLLILLLALLLLLLPLLHPDILLHLSARRPRMTPSSQISALSYSQID